tara:strand:- start:1883 stop:2212 length:330 start_codon:yes stop_codon:yes gene_type:complete
MALFCWGNSVNNFSDHVLLTMQSAQAAMGPRPKPLHGFMILLRIFLFRLSRSNKRLACLLRWRRANGAARRRDYIDDYLSRVQKNDLARIAEYVMPIFFLSDVRKGPPA